MPELIALQEYPLKDYLSKLLQDKTTGNNILFATDAYQVEPTEEMTVERLTQFEKYVIQPRVSKTTTEQAERTRNKAEVFTPSWICDKMISHCDEVSNLTDWKAYVTATRLEITCGEAPYLVSRYDTATGEIIPIPQRIGILDRKLKLVNEHTTTLKSWILWANKAFKSVYGYEFQGDSLLIARINLLMTFMEYLRERWNCEPTESQLETIVNIICWNLWQMDGLTGTIPFSKATDNEENFIGGLFDWEDEPETVSECLVYDWKQNKPIRFNSIKEGLSEMKFDFVIGNPPYQDETLGDNDTYAPPVYHLFMDSAFSIADKVELITPARFLFNAGSTPKAWNEKMLKDPHFKVLHFEQDSSKIFSNTSINGGIAIAYHDNQKKFGAVEVFTAFSELNQILHKVVSNSTFEGMERIVITRTAYRFTDTMHAEHPEAITQLSNGHAYDMSSNIFERLPQIFYDELTNDNYEYIRIYGKIGNQRLYKYVRKDYVREVKNLYRFKIVLARADGAAGTIGNPIPARIIGNPIIESPRTGTTETFLSVGSFETEIEAQNSLKYIKSKFARTMLGILKTTQDITPEKFKYVPLQDFTENSDIDWTKSIPEIDQQLYKKYGLTQEEIDFIESHVKEME